MELALVLTVLVLFLFGTIQLGIAYNRYQGLQAAAREGARVASIGGSRLEVQSRTRQSQSLFQGADVEVRIDYSLNDGASWPGSQVICDDGGGTPCTNAGVPTPCTETGLGNLVRVTARVPGSTGKYAIVIPLFGKQDVTYESSGVFRCERLGG